MLSSSVPCCPIRRPQRLSLDSSPDSVFGVVDTLGAEEAVSPLLGSLGPSTLDDPTLERLELPDSESNEFFLFEEHEEAPGAQEEDQLKEANDEARPASPEAAVMSWPIQPRVDVSDELEERNMDPVFAQSAPATFSSHVSQLRESAADLRKQRKFRANFVCPRGQDCVTRQSSSINTKSEMIKTRSAEIPSALMPHQAAQLGLPEGVTHVCTGCYAREVHASKYHRPKPCRGRTQRLDMGL